MDSPFNGGDTYYPVSPAEYASAVFQGYVTYDQVTYFSGDWGSEQDYFHIFTTYLLSETDQTIELIAGGDDGHSAFVNGTFMGGGGFAVPVPFSVTLRAGVPKKLQLAGYNNTGPWSFGFDPNPELVPGVTIHAALVPEPGALALILFGGVGLLGAAGRRGTRGRFR
jgi:hypothetical protein